MTNTISILNRNLFQLFPYHLVTVSYWPIFVSFSLLNLTIGAVAYMHGYPNGGTVFLLGLIITAVGMILWFRDIIVESTAEANLLAKNSSETLATSFDNKKGADVADI